jgi:hypothetical protein
MLTRELSGTLQSSRVNHMEFFCMAARYLCLFIMSCTLNSFIRHRRYVLDQVQSSLVLRHLFLIYHFIRNRALRQTLLRHINLAILIVNFGLITIDLVMTFHFLHFASINETRLGSFLLNLSGVFRMWPLTDLLIRSSIAEYQSETSSVSLSLPIPIVILYTL